MRHSICRFPHLRDLKYVSYRSELAEEPLGIVQIMGHTCPELRSVYWRARMVVADGSQNVIGNRIFHYTLIDAVWTTIRDGEIEL